MHFNIPNLNTASFFLFKPIIDMYSPSFFKDVVKWWFAIVLPACMQLMITVYKYYVHH